jgi:hypothetical protein
VTTAAPPATPKIKQTTEYVVVRNNETPEGAMATYTTVQKVRANSANDAIKKAAAGKEGVYIAIPARSFKPVKVTVHTETTIRLG